LETPDLIAICLIAFLAVFVLLGLLALAMHVITLIFPARKGTIEQTLVAAISSTVAAVYPGARVTQIEEES
jgi:hypothetical protein